MIAGGQTRNAASLFTETLFQVMALIHERILCSLIPALKRQHKNYVKKPPNCMHTSHNQGNNPILLIV